MVRTAHLHRPVGSSSTEAARGLLWFTRPSVCHLAPMGASLHPNSGQLLGVSAFAPDGFFLRW